MKLHIHNRTTLPLKVVGEVLDYWMNNSIDTEYVGKTHYLEFEGKGKTYQMSILINKTCTSVWVGQK